MKIGRFGHAFFNFMIIIIVVFGPGYSRLLPPMVSVISELRAAVKIQL